MPASRRGPGVLFHATAAATGLFVVSVLAMVATLFGDPAAPVNQWINAHGAILLVGEVIAIAVLGVAAMANDQWTNSRKTAPSPATSPERTPAKE